MKEKTRTAVMHVRITSFGTEKNLDRAIERAMDSLSGARFNVELVDVDVEDDNQLTDSSSMRRSGCETSLHHRTDPPDGGRYHHCVLQAAPSQGSDGGVGLLRA